MEKPKIVDAGEVKNYESVYFHANGYVRNRMKLRKRDMLRDMMQQHPSNGKKK